VLGKRRFVRSLHAQNLKDAQRLRHAAIDAFHQEIAEARRSTAKAPEMTAGRAWRELLDGVSRGDPGLVSGDAEGAESVLSDGLRDAYHTIDRGRGREAAETLRTVAQGRGTPLLHYVNAWLTGGGARGPLNERTKQFQGGATA
jgi:hypothetical protein